MGGKESWQGQDRDRDGTGQGRGQGQECLGTLGCSTAEKCFKTHPFTSAFQSF